MTPDSIAARKSAEMRLLFHAARDPAVLDGLRTAPRETIAEVLGVAVPEAVSIRVLDEEDDELLLVLPAAEDVLGRPDELSLDDLDAVAGGSGDKDDDW